MQKFYDPSVQKFVRCRTYLRSRESGSWTELGHSALLSELGTVSFSQRRVGSSDRQRWRPQLSSSGRTQTQGTIWRCPINPIGCTVTAINRHALANDVPLPTAAVHGEGRSIRRSAEGRKRRSPVQYHNNLDDQSTTKSVPTAAPDAVTAPNPRMAAVVKTSDAVLNPRSTS
jgi:hypothetical protein